MPLSSIFTDLEVAAFTLTSLSIALTYLLYIRSRKDKAPRFHIHTNHVLTGTGDEFEDLRLVWKDTTIPDFSVTTVFLWNAGREVVRREDLAGDGTFRVRLPEQHTLLDASLRFQSKGTNDAEIHKDSMDATISFDYLNHGQGIALQILHTGGLDETSAQALGDVKGGKALRRWRPPQDRRNMFLAFYLLGGVALSVYLSTIVARVSGWDPDTVGGAGALLGLIIFGYTGQRIEKSTFGVPRPFRTRFTMDYFFQNDEEP